MKRIILMVLAVIMTIIMPPRGSGTDTNPATKEDVYNVVNNATMNITLNITQAIRDIIRHIDITSNNTNNSLIEVLTDLEKRINASSENLTIDIANITRLIIAINQTLIAQHNAVLDELAALRSQVATARSDILSIVTNTSQNIVQALPKGLTESQKEQVMTAISTGFTRGLKEAQSREDMAYYKGQQSVVPWLIATLSIGLALGFIGRPMVLSVLDSVKDKVKSDSEKKEEKKESRDEEIKRLTKEIAEGEKKKKEEFYTPNIEGNTNEKKEGENPSTPVAEGGNNG